MSKKIKILLIVSLCLNIFLIGFVAGDIRHFSRPNKKEVAFIMDFMKKNKPLRKELDAERQKSFDLLKAENFNQAEYDAQINKISILQEKMFKEFATNIAEKLRAMPANERDEIIAKIEKGPRHGGHMKPCKDGKHDKHRQHDKPHGPKHKKDRGPRPEGPMHEGHHPIHEGPDGHHMPEAPRP